jgi:hemerythrin
MADLNFLEDWLLCHIQYEDREMARQLAEGGTALS